ncbi:hypothetical protein AK812_SmicGene46225, partial [Symbiodinium microadriaticum]
MPPRKFKTDHRRGGGSKHVSSFDEAQFVSKLDLFPSVVQLSARMGCTTSTVVESAQMGVFQDESGVITPEVRFKERSHSFHSMDDRTNPYTAAHASAPINFTHKHWVKQLES